MRLFFVTLRWDASNLGGFTLAKDGSPRNLFYVQFKGIDLVNSDFKVFDVCPARQSDSIQRNHMNRYCISEAPRHKTDVPSCFYNGNTKYTNFSKNTNNTCQRCSYNAQNMLNCIQIYSKLKTNIFTTVLSI